ncbi:response regulator [Flavisolibacter tropicus]|uniref:Response regulator receiver protein n=1 Tax=Flavisolibacter tropicus TaxID=1492898 RepID=A0A172TZ45_9BACT|nr:response regulator [Flavisolibacter tropicus]ANE52379.1 response regulator receiver protein [Flavisolibacter tropicus]
MKVVDILMVEDDSLDTMDIQRTLDKMKIMYKLQVVKNGEEAILSLQEREQESALPDIVLIDLNMPKMNGLEFLQVVRSTPAWKALKCFVITTSEEKVDRETANRLGVSGYIVKPFKLNNPSSMDSFNLMIDLMNLQN